MNLLELIPGVGSIIEKVVPDPNKQNELKIELAKLDTQEATARLGVLQAMFQNKSIFVSGAIPALIWVFVLSVTNNYILVPWARGFGLSIPDVPLPDSIVGLVGFVITVILGKKYKDDEETYYSNGQLKNPSKKRIQAEVAACEAAKSVSTVATVDYDDPEAVDARLKRIAREKGLL